MKIHFIVLILLTLVLNAQALSKEDSAHSSDTHNAQQYERLTKEIKTRLMRLDVLVHKNFTPNTTNSLQDTPNTDGEHTDPWTEIHNLQFYMWRSYAFDPQTMHPVHRPDGPYISATEITEDLENRFLLVKTAQWPSTLGVQAAFDEYISLCQEIIDFRKKRLYSDAKSIAKRGDLDEAYHHLVESIEAATENLKPKKTGDSAHPDTNKDVSEVNDLVKMLQTEIDELAKMTTYTSSEDVKMSSPGESTNITNSGAFSTLQEIQTSVKTAIAAIIDGGWTKKWNATQSLIVIIATFATLMLGLFLFGISRRPKLETSDNSADSQGKTTSTATTQTPLTTSIAQEEPAQRPLQNSPTTYSMSHSLDNAARTRLGAVVSVLENEECLASFVQMLTADMDDATAAQNHLQWLAQELDDLRQACKSANESCDLRILSAHLKQISSTPVKADSGLEESRCLRVRQEIIAKVKSALVSTSKADEALARKSA